MEIRTLRNFLAIAREENMTRAAESLHVSQPALSKQMKALEEELGKKLFVRHSFHISLTDEGVLLRDRAASLVEMADRIESEFTSMNDVIGGDLYLGLAESWQIRYLARVVSGMKKDYPSLRYHITSGDTEQVAEKLDKGLLDFAALAETPNTRKYNALPFPQTDVWGLVMPADDPLAAREQITIDDLVGLPLFCSEQAWRREIAAWGGERMSELTLEGSFRLAYNGAVFVRERLGCLLSFERLVDTSPGSGLVFRPLSPRLETKLYLVWKKSPAFSPIAARFLERVQAAFTSSGEREE
ncbi:MAG: LysR family transcriptional regulator [Pyramidobacter sp.]|nr:LysR family transcriptional regulator [Pyramidobacter sp.]